METYFKKSLLRRMLRMPLDESKGKGFYYILLKMPYFFIAYVIGIPCAIAVDFIFILFGGK